MISQKLINNSRRQEEEEVSSVEEAKRSKGTDT